MANGKLRLPLCFPGAAGFQEGFKPSVTLQTGCSLFISQMGSAPLSLHGNSPGPAASGEDLALPAKFLHPRVARY